MSVTPSPDQDLPDQVVAGHAEDPDGEGPGVSRVVQRSERDGGGGHQTVLLAYHIGEYF